MFQEEYKKYYDDIHPSAELIARTKKRAMEMCEEKSDDKDLENWETDLLENLSAEKDRKWWKIAGSMAAGLVLVVSVGYLIHTLQPMKHQTSSGNLAGEEQAGTVSGSSVRGSGIKNGRISDYVDSSAMSELANTERASVTLDFASEQMVIFHSNFGVVMYKPQEQVIGYYLRGADVYGADDWKEYRIYPTLDGQLLYIVKKATQEAWCYDYSDSSYTTVNIDEVWTQNLYLANNKVTGTKADLYREDSTQSILIQVDSNNYTQLVFLVPKSKLQASLAIAQYNSKTGQETCLKILGQYGWSALTKEESTNYENYMENQPLAFIHKDKKNHISNTKNSGKPQTKTTVRPTESPEATQLKDGDNNLTDNPEENAVTEAPVSSEEPVQPIETNLPEVTPDSTTFG